MNNLITFPSKKTLDEQKPKYTLLPQDDYTLKITEVKEEKQKKYQSEEFEIVESITFEILSLKDGSTPTDEKGKTVIGRKVFFKARPTSTGFMQDGTPSKTRQLVAYTTNQDILEDIELNSWQDLKNEIVNAEIIQYLNQKGEKGNKISRFLPIKKKVQIKKEDIPIVEDEIDASEIFS